MDKKSNIELSVKEAANSIGVSTRSILNYIRSKEIEAIKVGKRWFIKEPSLKSFAKRYRFEQDASTIKFNNKEVNETTTVIKTKSTKKKNKYLVGSLRLYTIAQEAFLMEKWNSLDKQELLSMLEKRLILLKLEALEFIGAGYLSFNTLEKRDLYNKSRQKIGAILALLYISDQMRKQWAKEISFIEEELLSAYSSLIRKMENISEK